MKTVAVEKPKTLEELEKEHELLTSILKEYLMVVGVEYSMLDDVIRDLKEQMYMHADQNVNNMIADLINLENKIIYAKADQKKKLGEGPQQY